MAAWKGQFAVAAWQSLSLLANISDAHCSVTGNYWPLSTCDLWMAPLIGVKEGRGICSNSVTKFYDSNGFLTSIFPNHSSEAWTKIIWYRLCFYHNTWHRDKKKRGGTKQPTLHCIVCFWYLRTCTFIFCWREESQIYTWICSPSRSFVSPRENFFFPRIPAAVFGGFKGWKRGKEKPIGFSATETPSRAKLSSHLD